MIERMLTLARLFWTADLLFPRSAIALGSLFWAIGLLIAPGSFERPIYLYMKMIAPVYAWAAMFGAIGLFQLWNVFNLVPVHARAMNQIIAGLHLWIWCASTVALAASVAPFPPSIAANIAISFLTVVVFVRSVAGRG